MIVHASSTPHIRDIMTRNPVTVSPDDSIRQVASIFHLNEISGAPVVDEQNRIIGVVSKTDLLEWMIGGAAAGISPEDIMAVLADDTIEVDTEVARNRLGTAKDFMSTQPLTASPDELVSTVAHRLAEQRVHRAIVINPDRTVAGVVTSLDLLKAFPRPHEFSQTAQTLDQTRAASSTSPTQAPDTQARVTQAAGASGAGVAATTGQPVQGAAQPPTGQSTSRAQGGVTRSTKSPQQRPTQGEQQ